MSSIPTLPGIISRTIDTPRLRIHALLSGPEHAGETVLFVHGNASSATFWEEQMLLLPPGLRAVAPDLRGYGDTEDLPVDATRGYGDWVADLLGLLDTLGVERFHAVGHSLGGGVVYGLLIAAPERVATLTLVCPISPYGFGGTRGLDGRPCYEDCAGSGGGVVNPDFAQNIAAHDRSSDQATSPRVVMNVSYWKPPFVPARIEELLSSVLSQRIGPRHYPGDSRPSPNWPGVAPGVWGPANAMSPRYVRATADALVAAPHKPPVLWVRGSDDIIVSDSSVFDLAELGRLGIVPSWPGAEIHPPQPMVAQTRSVLERYAAAGGRFREVVIPDTGHSPFIERPEEFSRLLAEHLGG